MQDDIAPNEVKMPNDGLPDKVPERPSNLAKTDKRENFNEKRARVIGGIFLIGVRIAAISIGVLFIVRVIHFIAPYKLQWLCTYQVEQIDRFLFSGVVGALVGKYFDEAFSSKLD